MRHGRPYPPPHNLSIHYAAAPSSTRTTTGASTVVLPARRDSEPRREQHHQQQEQQHEQRESLKRHVTQPPAHHDLPSICPAPDGDAAFQATCAGALHAFNASKRAVRYYTDAFCCMVG